MKGKTLDVLITTVSLIVGVAMVPFFIYLAVSTTSVVLLSVYLIISVFGSVGVISMGIHLSVNETFEKREKQKLTVARIEKQRNEQYARMFSEEIKRNRAK